MPVKYIFLVAEGPEFKPILLLGLKKSEECALQRKLLLEDSGADSFVEQASGHKIAGFVFREKPIKKPAGLLPGGECSEGFVYYPGSRSGRGEDLLRRMTDPVMNFSFSQYLVESLKASAGSLASIFDSIVEIVQKEGRLFVKILYFDEKPLLEKLPSWIRELASEEAYSREMMLA